jgi:hypothetical protein
VHTPTKKLISHVKQYDTSSADTNIIAQATKMSLKERSVIIHQVSEWLECEYWKVDYDNCPHFHDTIEAELYTPMVYNEWISNNKLKLKNGKNFSPTIDCYIDLRGNIEIPDFLPTKVSAHK